MFSLTPLGDVTRFRHSNIKREVYLVTEDVCIKADGIILAARSAKLEEMLEESDNIPALEFSDDVTGLVDCLDLVYGGNVEIREDNFKTIYKFGKLFQIREMMESVLSWIAISVTYDKFWSVYLELKNLHDDNSVFVDIIKGYLSVDGDNFLENLREICRSTDKNTITAVVELLSRTDDKRVLSVMENIIDTATENNETPAATASSTDDNNYLQIVVSSTVTYIENCLKSDSFDECNKSRCKQILQMASNVCTHMETLREVNKILLDTSIHTVTNTDTSSQPSSSSTFTAQSTPNWERNFPSHQDLLSSSKSKEESSQTLPYSCVENTLVRFRLPSYSGSFTVKDLNLERVKQLICPTTSYDAIKDFTKHAGSGIHPCVVVEIVLKWWSERADREHFNMSFMTPLIAKIQNVSSAWFYCVCKDERYTGLIEILNISRTATEQHYRYMRYTGGSRNNDRIMKACISKGDGAPVQLEDLGCSDSMERYKQSVPAFRYNATIFPPYGDTKHHWFIRIAYKHVSLVTNSKAEILNLIKFNYLELHFVPPPDTLQ